MYEKSELTEISLARALLRCITDDYRATNSAGWGCASRGFAWDGVFCECALVGREPKGGREVEREEGREGGREGGRQGGREGEKEIERASEIEIERDAEREREWLRKQKGRG